MKPLFLLSSILITLIFSCKTKKETTKTNQTQRDITSIITPTIVDSDNNESNTIVYRLIVSFISKGSGINIQKRNDLIKFVASHPKKPNYKTILWGREGENDFCFTLSELNSKEINAFINEVKKIDNSSDMMHISQNIESQHIGR